MDRETLPMIFVYPNGKPKIYVHHCDQSREGQLMTERELLAFALKLLTDYYQKQGMEVAVHKRSGDKGFPNFVMESKSGTKFYVAVRTSLFPVNPLDISREGFDDFKKLAKQFNSRPVFAGVSFACTTSYHQEINNLSIATCGGEYFVAFRGLINL